MLRKYNPGIPGNLIKPEDLFKSLPVYPGGQTLSDRNVQSISDHDQICSQIQDLSCTYLRASPLAHQALHNLNLEVRKGHMHALIGATGSGKSTVLQHINGLIHPQSGSVRVDQFDLSDEALDIQALRRKTALAFQQPEDQIFEQYIGDEVAYAPRHLGYSGNLADVVEKAMQAVGLDFLTYKDRLTSNLSGGEKRKVALASILAIQSEILLLDEPLSGLDPRSTSELLQTLSQLHQAGKTLLISTHQYEEIIPMLESVSVIHNGTDSLHGNPEAIFSQVLELEQTGLKAPLAVQIASDLRKLGWPIVDQAVSLPLLESQLSLIARGENK